MDNFHNDEDFIIISAAFVICLSVFIKYKTKCRSIWVNGYLAQRKLKGRFVNDFEDMRGYPAIFRENFHVSVEEYDHILKLREKLLSAKRNTRPKDKIGAKEKLAITLDFWFNEPTYCVNIYRISKQDFGGILDVVCNAICIALKDEIRSKLSNKDWIEVSNDFHSKWNFLNCLGAIDDVGGYGSEGDASYFSSSEVGQCIVNNTMTLPKDTTFGPRKIPFFFLGDSGFPLCERVITPYSYRGGRQTTRDEIIFNYRLSRARRCVENTFGILSMKWLCLSRTMFCSPDRAQKIVSACSLLHNFLLKKSPELYCPKSLVDHYDCNGLLIEGS